jgi:DNA-binding winged helix-turn-helix (wHTH) protein/Flp pilus assembly protein TadD
MQEFREFPKKAERTPRARLYQFGPFVLNPRKRIVLRDNQLVPLTPKCFDILLVLVENRGEVMVKDELMDSVWQDTVVEEGNLNRNISTLRKALGESPNDHRYIVTVPGRGYRFVAEVQEVLEEPLKAIPRDGRSGADSSGGSSDGTGKIGALQAVPLASPAIVRPAPAGTRHFFPKRYLWPIVAVAAGAMAIAAIYALRTRPKPTLTANDSILIADFSNSTGDAVFDDTLKQAVSADLSQSPYLNILSDAKVQATLRLMTRPQDTPLTGEVARELCQRAGGKAYINGSIARLDSQYVVGLNAVDCASGDFIVREQVKAESKDRVLTALDRAGSTLRQKLGESRNTLREFDTPLMEATTPSLDALKAYTVGLEKDKTNDAEAIPFFKRAIELDPEFASAYSALAACYWNMSESGLARENFKMAFALRNHVSEREKLLIAARYYDHVTGELPKAIEAYQLWAQAYPRDARARGNLGTLYGATGQYEKAIAQTEEALRLEPDSGTNYSNLLLAQAALDRFGDARDTFNQGMARKIEDPILRVNWFGVAFVTGDATEMEKQMSWSAAKPEAEDNFLAAKSDMEAYHGRAKSAREYSAKAFESALRNDEKEAAAQWKMDEAIREAEFGNRSLSRQDTAAARALTTSHDTEILAAVALARTGDSGEAEKLAAKLEKQYPLDTLIVNYWLPVIRASGEISRANPAKAVELLQPAAPYELASPVTWSGLGGPMYPSFLRGEAFLMLRQGHEAELEYQNIIDHPGFMLACPLGGLAHLGKARALLLQGEKARARSSYQEFFILWKDGDRETPVLQKAKTEYANAQ